MNAEKRDNLIRIVLPCIYCSFTLGIFAPIEVFYGNITNVWYDLPDILPMVGITFSAMMLVLTSVAFLLNKAGNIPFQIYSWTLVILTTCLYIQGNFIPNDYNKLGDETINWADYSMEGYYNTLAWCGMLAVMTALLFKVGVEKYWRVFKVIIICAILVQIITLATVAVSRGKYTGSSKYVASTEKEYSYSEKENLIVLVLDTYDSRIMSDLLAEDGEKYATVLEDFTFYENTLGSYGLTDFSIPHILTGEKYLNQCTYGEYSSQAFSESPLLAELRKQGYDMGIYTTVTLPQGECAEWFDNWHTVDYAIEDGSGFWIDYYRMLGFRYFPHYLKKMVYFNVDNMDEYREMVAVDGDEKLADSMEVFPWGNIEFYENIDNITADCKQPAFRFIHLKGLHSYRDMYGDMKLHKDEKELSVEEEGKVILDLVGKYLDKLKEEAVYENSAIIIMADHGSVAYENAGTSHTPLLLVKGKKEKHEFIISQAPVSYDDLQNCFLKMLNNTVGEDLFEAREGDERTRYIYFTDYCGALKADSKSAEFVECATDGHVKLTYLLRDTGKIYK